MSKEDDSKKNLKLIRWIRLDTILVVTAPIMYFIIFSLGQILVLNEPIPRFLISISMNFRIFEILSIISCIVIIIVTHKYGVQWLRAKQNLPLREINSRILVIAIYDSMSIGTLGFLNGIIGLVFYNYIDWLVISPLLILGFLHSLIIYTKVVNPILKSYENEKQK